MLADLKDRINVDAEYQRGSVWSKAQQALLIDSILRGFDIPKIYLAKLPDGSPHLFDVIDGKQRLMAIWSFLDDELRLRRAPGTPDDLEELGGKTWSELPDDAKDRLQFASMTVSKLENASKEQIRELFLRLQEGETLRAAERRNAVAGPVRNFVRELALHALWPKTAIRSARFGWHEHSAILLALAEHEGPTDLKGADLQRLYEDRGFDPDGAAARRAQRLLDTLEGVADAAGDEKVLRTRWGIVDLAVVLMRAWAEGRRPESNVLAGFFKTFEAERLQVGRELSDLQARVFGLSADELREDVTIELPWVKSDMFEYYLSFSREGATEENVTKRSNVMYGRLVSLLDAGARS